MGLNPAGSPGHGLRRSPATTANVTASVVPASVARTLSVPGVSPTVYATADVPESETVVVSALTRPLPWVTVHVTRACFTALPLKTPTVSGSGSDCPSGAPCWLPDTMAILVLSPGDPSAGVKQPASRTRRVTESRGCSAHATVSGLHEGWRDRVGRMRANFLRAQKLRDHLGAMSRSTAYSSTILFVANFPA